jgi:chromosome segregation ATPase
MARPLATSKPHGGGTNDNYPEQYILDDPSAQGVDSLQELEHLRGENNQLRALCAELEQALQEATQGPDPAAQDERIREYEALLEEKTEMIRSLHQQLQEAQGALEEIDSRPAGDAPAARGPVPAEDELLRLSEELERERRQLQEDEESLMAQMRQMELSMARERAEMARQRNDLQRLYGEIRHELERLERNGALQSKMEELKAKLQDVQNRRGAAPQSVGRPATPPTATPANGTPEVAPAAPPPGKKEGFMGRLFGSK